MVVFTGQYLVLAPHVVDLIGILGDAFDHNGIAGAVECFLESLAGQQDVDFRCRDKGVHVVLDVVGLDGVHEDQLGKDQVVHPFFMGGEEFVVLGILSHVDLFGKPGVCQHHIP